MTLHVSAKSGLRHDVMCISISILHAKIPTTTLTCLIGALVLPKSTKILKRVRG